MSLTLRACRQKGILNQDASRQAFCASLSCHFFPVASQPGRLAAPQSCAVYHQPQDSSLLMFNTLSPFLPRFSSALRTANLETLEGYTQEKSKELSAETLKELQVGARNGCEMGQRRGALSKRYR